MNEIITSVHLPGLLGQDPAHSPEETVKRLVAP